jgi:hypothetical protein
VGRLGHVGCLGERKRWCGDGCANEGVMGVRGGFVLFGGRIGEEGRNGMVLPFLDSGNWGF